MPELPEVEIVCRNLEEMIPRGSLLQGCKFFRKDLRYIIPQAKLKKLIGAKILGVNRRAKYILFDCGEEMIISHLGMTGSWRREDINWQKRTHDHLFFKIGDYYFVYNDARRFGFIEVVESHKLGLRFKGLGFEPLDEATDFSSLSKRLQKLNTPIKSAIMNQKYIVGIGNIYASEILYKSRISPLTSCSKVSLKAYDKIWRYSREILQNAIQRGGSTIDDYRNGYGEQGQFQNEFYVYGKENEKCQICHTKIKQKVIAGRSSFWCPKCQS